MTIVETMTNMSVAGIILTFLWGIWFIFQYGWMTGTAYALAIFTVSIFLFAAAEALRGDSNGN